MTVLDDLPAPAASESTPRRLFRPEAAGERFTVVARLRDVLGRPPVGLVAAFSVKTNPRAELLRMAREHGFFAEVISSEELQWVKRHGFGPEETVYNGPEPLLDGAGEALAFTFADSVEALARNIDRCIAQVHGVRLRPSMLASRFGVPVDDEAELTALIEASPPETRLGVSFHARREDFRGASWRDVAGDVLERAVALEARTGRRVVAFDVGGGWRPDEFDATFHPDIRWLVDLIVDRLPFCTKLIFEPGQAVCTPTEALLTRVLEVRARRGRREAVVDLGYSDWPQMHAYVHGFFAWREGRWAALGRGPDRLLGRTCLEYDLVEGLRFPPDLAAGETLLIADAGSYDHSMAFDFARGDERHRTMFG